MLWVSFILKLSKKTLKMPFFWFRFFNFEFFYLNCLWKVSSQKIIKILYIAKIFSSFFFVPAHADPICEKLVNFNFQRFNKFFIFLNTFCIEKFLNFLIKHKNAKFSKIESKFYFWFWTHSRNVVQLLAFYGRVPSYALKNLIRLFVFVMHQKKKNWKPKFASLYG